MADTERGSDLPWGVPPSGYRLPAATRPGLVRLQVADLQRSLDYYTAIIGLQVLQQVAGRATLGPAGGQALVELHEQPGATPAPRRGRLGLFHFALLVPDRRTLGMFLAHLADQHRRVGASDHRVSEALYLHDPDGLGIEVYADRPRTEWQYTDRQLVMTTRPLDLRDLIHRASGEPWRGMPNGTVVGHVHLHVGDLDAAEAFYHHALGLDKVVWNYPGALFLSAGGYHHHLAVNTWAGTAPPAGDGEARLLEWELVVPQAEDADQAMTSLGAAGYRVERDQRGAGRVRDPWGTTLRIRPA